MPAPLFSTARTFMKCLLKWFLLGTRLVAMTSWKWNLRGAGADGVTYARPNIVHIFRSFLSYSECVFSEMLFVSLSQLPLCLYASVSGCACVCLYMCVRVYVYLLLCAFVCARACVWGGLYRGIGIRIKWSLLYLCWNDHVPVCCWCQGFCVCVQSFKSLIACGPLLTLPV